MGYREHYNVRHNRTYAKFPKNDYGYLQWFHAVVSLQQAGFEVEYVSGYMQGRIFIYHSLNKVVAYE